MTMAFIWIFWFVTFSVVAVESYRKYSSEKEPKLIILRALVTIGDIVLASLCLYSILIWLKG